MTATDVANDLPIDLQLTLSLQVTLHIESGIDEGSRRWTSPDGLRGARKTEPGNRLDGDCFGAALFRLSVENHLCPRWSARCRPSLTGAVTAWARRLQRDRQRAQVDRRLAPRAAAGALVGPQAAFATADQPSVSENAWPSHLSFATAAIRCVSIMLMVTPANRRRVIARG